MNQQPKPVFIAPTATDFSVICPYCVSDKNSPFVPEREPFGNGTNEEEGILLRGTLPLESEADWFECEHGHRQFVIRLGTERAANFGRPS